MESMIFAVDFDGVVVEDNFPNIGRLNMTMAVAIKTTREYGHQVVLWTCRVGERLLEAVDFCRENNIEFDAINASHPNNLAMYITDPRKIYADYYVDDRSIGFDDFGIDAIAARMVQKAVEYGTPNPSRR